jgi:hypothetical protein
MTTEANRTSIVDSNKSVTANAVHTRLLPHITITEKQTDKSLLYKVSEARRVIPLVAATTTCCVAKKRQSTTNGNGALPWQILEPGVELSWYHGNTTLKVLA